MTIFNEIMIKNIIIKYFDKDHIKNYIYYDNSYFIFLSTLLNNIYESEYYNEKCQIFFANYYCIDIDNLLCEYPIIMNCQPIILLLYEILAQTNQLDSYNIKIDNFMLYDEIINNNTFGFLYDKINDLEFNNNLDELNDTLNNIKF
jgi:hypothetical protein